MWWHKVDDYTTKHSWGRKKILAEGESKGKDIAEGDYPFAVVEGQDLTQRAQEMFQNWHTTGVEWIEERIKLEKRSYDLKPTSSKRYDPVGYDPAGEDKKKLATWNAQLDEARRLYVSAFISSYIEKVAELVEEDKKRGKQPRYTQAALSNVATLQGATITLKRVERKTNEYVYHLELTDPENFDGVEKTEWVVYFEGASVPATEAAMPTAAYGMSFSDVAFSYGSSTPQKTARKPKGSYLRSPK